MANIRSAEKQNRQAEKRKTRNRAEKSKLKSALKTAKAAIAGGDTSKEVLSKSFSVIDKAAKKGLIKNNTADRYKSRLAGATKRAAKDTKKAEKAKAVEVEETEAAEAKAVEFEGGVAPLEDGSAPEGYTIKGNADSMKYHEPDGQWYDQTIAEVWCKSAEDAEAAGFTKAGA